MHPERRAARLNPHSERSMSIDRPSHDDALTCNERFAHRGGNFGIQPGQLAGRITQRQGDEIESWPASRVAPSKNAQTKHEIAARSGRLIAANWASRSS